MTFYWGRRRVNSPPRLRLTEAAGENSAGSPALNVGTKAAGLVTHRSRPKLPLLVPLPVVLVLGTWSGLPGKQTHYCPQR